MNVLPEADDIHGYYCKDLSVGMTPSCAETDFVLFAGISGDVNPVHLNEKFATKTMFEGRITHGMLTANFIFTVLETKLSGPGCIYPRQGLRFLAPVHPDDTARPKLALTDVSAENKRIYADTGCHMGDTSVVEGEATLFVPKRRKADAA